MRLRFRLGGSLLLALSEDLISGYRGLLLLGDAAVVLARAQTH